MAKNEQNLKKNEEFVKKILAKYFHQRKIDPDRLREAAEKLCDAMPSEKAA